MASPSDRGHASPDEASLDSKRHALADLFGSSDDEASPPPTERVPTTPSPAADEADDSDDFDLGTSGPADSTSRPTRHLPAMSDTDDDDGAAAPTNPETNDDMADLFGDEVSPLGSPIPAEPVGDDEKNAAEMELAALDEPLAASIAVKASDPALTQQEHYVTKVPNFLRVEAEPFDPETYEAVSLAAAGEGAQITKLKLDNTLRWRRRPTADETESDDSALESNGRLVRWSDGTMSLFLGGEYFDAIPKPLDSSHHLLTVLHPTDGLLQGKYSLTHSLAFKPSSTSSLTHKTFTQAISDRHKKTIKTRFVNTTKDPELEKREVEMRENEKLRAQRRLEASRLRKAMRYSLSFNEGALEAEEGSGLDGSPRSYAGGSGRGPRRRFADDGGRPMMSRQETYEDDEGFVVDDDIEEEEFVSVDEDEDEDDEDADTGRDARRGPDEAEREQRIVQAKQRGMDRYQRHERSPTPDSLPEEAETDGGNDAPTAQANGPEAQARRPLKRRNLMWSDDEEDE
ncbi:Paf1 complex component [Dimargaris verticillata]|uniref:Paf1 complex component n=1 Tax=Dimargaris verticillata TaxID=2761393 RepID=A0A9W8B915_9FUNG|nr:Paf1 complex component [Dimargaris verticillata]